MEVGNQEPLRRGKIGVKGARFALPDKQRESTECQQEAGCDESHARVEGERPPPRPGAHVGQDGDADAALDGLASHHITHSHELVSDLGRANREA